MIATKKLKVEEQVKEQEIDSEEKMIFINFKDPEGQDVGEVIEIPLNTKPKELEERVNILLKNEERRLYNFFYET